MFMRWLRDRVNESSFLSSHFGDKLDTLMVSEAHKSLSIILMVINYYNYADHVLLNTVPF